MARILISRRNRICSWCQIPIFDGQPMKWNMRLGSLAAIHPDCEDAAVRKSRELMRHQSAGENS